MVQTPEAIRTPDGSTIGYATHGPDQQSMTAQSMVLLPDAIIRIGFPEQTILVLWNYGLLPAPAHCGPISFRDVSVASAAQHPRIRQHPTQTFGSCPPDFF